MTGLSCDGGENSVEGSVELVALTSRLCSPHDQQSDGVCGEGIQGTDNNLGDMVKLPERPNGTQTGLVKRDLKHGVGGKDRKEAWNRTLGQAGTPPMSVHTLHRSHVPRLAWD